MRNWLFLAIAYLFILGYSNLAKAGNTILANPLDENYRSIIKVELYFGGIEYEYKLNDQSSLNLSMQMNGILNLDKHDLQIIPEYKYYLSRWLGSPNGFYLGSYLFYRDYNVSKNIQSEGLMIYSRDYVKTAGLGVKIGYQTLFLERFSFDFGVGLGYNVFRDVKHALGIGILNESSLNKSITGGVTVGYAF